MKKILFLAALAALASCRFIDYAAGNGVSVDTELNTGDFAAIASHGSLDIIYTQTDGKSGATLTCDENLVEYYRIVVEGGTLSVGTRNNVIINPKVRSVLTVHSPVLNSVSVSGSGGCVITGPLACDGDLGFKVSGSGSIRVEGTVECRNFSSSISGSGRINVSGVLADAARFKGSGSGSTSVGPLSSDKVSVTLSGSGRARIDCRDAGDIDVSISGSGGVVLTGNAQSLSSSVSGSGRIDSKGLVLGK